MVQNVDRLRGSVCPVVTPFNERDEVDEGKLRELIDWQLDNGTHGISVTGTTGEPSSLTLEERERVMAIAVEHVAGRVPVILGTGSTNHKETLYLTKRAEELGADAALVIVPYYNKPSQEGLYQHFRRVAESVEIPIIVYNIPGRTAVNLEPETLARLREACPNVVGVKESNKNFEQVSHVLRLCGRDFLVYSGIETLCYPILAVGGAGFISATCNVLPREMSKLYELVQSGRWQEAIDLHYRLLPLNDALFWETNPGPLKTALGMMGKIHPALRLPLVPPNEEMQAKLREILRMYQLVE